jgi:hypothetical protein
VSVAGPLVLPGTERYEKLDAKDKFAWCREAVLVEQDRDVPDLDLLVDLHSELHFQRAEATLLDPVWDLEHNIHIADLEGRSMLFHPFPIQQRILDNVVGKWQQGIPVRLLIPKARRHGVSAVIGVVFYSFVARGEGRRCMVVAHNDEDAITLFDEKYLFTHRNDPLAPKAARASVGELYFAEINGRITVRSAFGRRGVGHGGGYHALHLSEASRYPETEEGYQLVTGLIEAVPKPPAFSMVIVESTAFGQQGWFYEECLRAKQGSGGFELMFLPWYERHDASRPFADAAGKAKFEASLSEEERVLRDTYTLDLERLNWRRHVFEHDIKAATQAERRRLMKQEHPTTMMEAFQSTGNSAFDQEQIDTAMLKARKPLFQGEITSPHPMRGRRGELEEATPRPHVRAHASGNFVYWARPRPHHRYSIGVDLAQGRAKGDFSVAMVYDRDAHQFVARYRARLGAKSMLDAVRLMSRWYNDAIINPEDNFAPDFIDDLKHTDRRGFLYWRIKEDRSSTRIEYKRAFGWNTNTKTKKYMVHTMQELLERQPDAFVDQMLLEEMRVFPQELNSRGDVVYPGVPANVDLFDDVLIAASLAIICDRDMPLRGRGPTDLVAAKQRTVDDRWNEMVSAHERNDRYEDSALEYE